MPIRACTCHDAPAMRWGRHGTPYTYGPGTGRTARDAAALAYRQGQLRAARRLAHDVAVHQPRRLDGLRRAPRRRGDQRFASRITDMHERMLQQRVDLVQRLLFDFAGSSIRGLETELRERAGRRVDADVGDVIRIFDVVRVIRSWMGTQAAEDAEGLRWLGDEIDEDVTDGVDRDVSRLFTIPLAAAAGSQELVDGWISDNVSLITSLTGTALDEVEVMVREAMSGGRPTLNLAEDIMQRFAVSWARASLIARDQTAKLASRINHARQTEYGITRYQWSTSGDPRVRQSHASLDGQIFAWDKGAPGQRGARIHPGEEYQCRCDAIAVMPDDDVSSLLAAAEARKERELEIMQRGPTVQGGIPNRSGFGDWNRARLEEIRKGARASVGLGSGPAQVLPLRPASPGPGSSPRPASTVPAKPPVVVPLPVPAKPPVRPPPAPRPPSPPAAIPPAPSSPAPPPKPPSWQKTGAGYVMQGGPFGGKATLQKTGKTWTLTVHGKSYDLGKRATFSHAEGVLEGLAKGTPE